LGEVARGGVDPDPFPNPLRGLIRVLKGRMGVPGPPPCPRIHQFVVLINKFGLFPLGFTRGKEFYYNFY